MNEEYINVFSSEDYAKCCERVKNCQEKVFISGSISIKWLEENDIQYLKCIIDRSHTVLIGDAYGVDRVVQQYFAKHNYQKIIVYFSGDKIRNNIGNWQTKQIANPENLTGRALYQLKDKAMADDCDFGIMFWDGKSKGTKHNIDYLNKLGKDYFADNEKDSTPEEIELSDAEYQKLDEDFASDIELDASAVKGFSRRYFENNLFKSREEKLKYYKLHGHISSVGSSSGFYINEKYDPYSVDELEKIAIRAKEDYDEDEHDAALRMRKQKLNLTFKWTPKNKEKLLRLNEQLIDCFEKLKAEAGVLHETLKRRRDDKNENFLTNFYIKATVRPYITNVDSNNPPDEFADILNGSIGNGIIFYNAIYAENLLNEDGEMGCAENWNKDDLLKGQFNEHFISAGIIDLCQSTSYWSLYDILKINWLAASLVVEYWHSTEIR